MWYRLFTLSLSGRVMHGAHPNIDINIMNKYLSNFPLCGGCSRREIRVGLKDGEYYCAIAEKILPKGTVTNDMDATNCVRNDWFKSRL